MAVARVKILFIARHFTYFRNYESVIAALAQQGHQIHLAAERDEYLGGRAMVERLAARIIRPPSRSDGFRIARTSGRRS